MKRKIKASKKMSIRGKTKSIKMKRMIHWESTIERDFIKLFDYIDDFVYIEEQPIVINFLHKGKQRKYYPDFLIKTKEGFNIIYEIKYSNKLTDEENIIKFQVGKKYCEENNMLYKVITEKEIRDGFFIDNLDLLIEVRENFKDILLHKKIIDSLEEYKTLSIKELISRINAEPQSIFEAVYQLIYEKRIKTDFYRNKLSSESILKLT
jgi:hypothetical protein